MRVSLARGDGIGPEITDAVIRIIEASGANVEFEPIVIGEKAYESGHLSGITDDAWESINRNRVLLKGPITTPQGKGYKSVNVTLRKSYGLYANVRVCTAYDPYISTKHSGMDVTIIRENEEDTYAGIEHRQTQEVAQCLKLISKPGCERIIRYAFEYATLLKCKRVTCFTKDNIMKKTDGMFRRVFDEISKDYEIESNHMIIDIGAARLADDPTQFDVIVTPNLYGDIISDIAGQISGSIGLCGSMNVGSNFAMFEAIHGSAPDIAGQNIANPTGLLMASVDMLNHIGETDAAARIINAWYSAISVGIKTKDITSAVDFVGTNEFADAIIERLGTFNDAVDYNYDNANIGEIPKLISSRGHVAVPEEKKMVGTDIFLDYDERGRSSVELADKLQRAIRGTKFELKMITNRGVKVWPNGNPNTTKTDHWRCRFMSVDNQSQVISLLMRMEEFDVIKTENLYTFDGVPGYSVAQGE